MAVRIIPFEDALWPELRQFLHDQWQANHPLCHRELFYWQYHGFGPAAGLHNCRVALDGGRIVGFLGAIPGIYQFDGRQVPGVALALWVVAQEYRNSGLGILLMREVAKQGEVVLCLGVAPAVFRYYLATGYKLLPALHRYVVPLDAGAYAMLLDQPVDAATIGRWCPSPAARLPEPKPIDADELAAIWAVSASQWKLSLVRTPEFWAWRYTQAVGFEYLQFGDARRGAVVARLDRISSTDKPSVDGKSVLRIIEVLPVEAITARPQESFAESSRGTAEVLVGLLAWAKTQGAIAADFQCSSTRLEPWLYQAGLRKRSENDPVTQLPELFNPLRYSAAQINLMVKAKGWTDADFDTAYMVKSDGDMDRPVRWPVE